ncbi:MECR [Symbiodinium microadriaticum]|nr:MECR [Symbiodinium microadriaticum]
METLTAILVGGGCFGWLKHRRKPKSVEEVPPKMQRLVLREANKDITLAKLEIEEVDTPQPKPGQLLIKVLAAPVNPSDDGAWKTPPSHGYPLPLGNEGSGLVVATGGGVWASHFVGKKSGTPYFAFPDIFCRPQDACAYFVNPFTVISIVEAVRSKKGKAFIHTAAASQLGQMMVKYCQKEGIALVNLVRRKEQVELLQKLGAKYIVNTSDPEWKSMLGKMMMELQISQVVDCIAGDFTAELIELLPPGGTAWVYGRLSGKDLSSINPIQLIYFGKKLEGFLVSSWIFKDGMVRGLLRARKQAAIVAKNFDIFGSQGFKDVSMKDMHQAYCSHLASGATGGKLRVRPWSFKG